MQPGPVSNKEKHRSNKTKTRETRKVEFCQKAFLCEPLSLTSSCESGLCESTASPAGQTDHELYFENCRQNDKTDSTAPLCLDRLGLRCLASGEKFLRFSRTAWVKLTGALRTSSRNAASFSSPYSWSKRFGCKGMS